MTEGMDILTDITRARGAQSVNTYVVLAQQAVEWASVGGLSIDERKELLLGVRGILEEGVRHHAGNRHFDAAKRDVDAAYLGLAVPGTGY
jgi:hypothetical protein